MYLQGICGHMRSQSRFSHWNMRYVFVLTSLTGLDVWRTSPLLFIFSVSFALFGLRFGVFLLAMDWITWWCVFCAAFSPASRLLWWICLFLRPTWSVIAQAILSGWNVLARANRVAHRWHLTSRWPLVFGTWVLDTTLLCSLVGESHTPRMFINECARLWPQWAGLA